MTEEQLITYGLPALFLISLLASSILPLGSEWLLAALVIQQQDITLTVAVATIGNTCGALTTYGLGYLGKGFIVDRILKIDEKRRAQSEQLFSKFGIWALLLSWLPIVGDPLCFVAGVLRTKPLRFIPPVFIGKAIRYWLVATAALSLAG